MIKTIITYVSLAALCGVIYASGYASGSRRGHERVVMEMSRYAADTCIVHTLATLKTATRMVEAKNRQMELARP